MTKVILKARASGKTHDLIEACARYPYALIVTTSTFAAREIMAMAREMRVRIPSPITYDEFRQGRVYGKVVDAFLLDDADRFLQSLAGRVPIAYIALNDNDALRRGKWESEDEHVAPEGD